MDDLVEEISEMQKRVFQRALDQGYTGGLPLTLSEVRNAVNRLLSQGSTLEDVGRAVNLSPDDVRGLGGGTLSGEQLLGIAQFPDGKLWEEVRDAMIEQSDDKHG